MPVPSFIWVSRYKGVLDPRDLENRPHNSHNSLMSLKIENPIVDDWIVYCYDNEKANDRDHRSHYDLRFYVGKSYSLKYQGTWCDLGLTASCPIDSAKGLNEIISYLTMRLGATDRDFFNEYSQKQLNWINSSDCEYLSLLCEDLRSHSIS